MGSFELLVPSESPMRGVVCLLETPCASPREMGLGQGGMASPVVRPWAYVRGNGKSPGREG